MACENLARLAVNERRSVALLKVIEAGKAQKQVCIDSAHDGYMNENLLLMYA